MLKYLTLSMTLVAALGFAGVVNAAGMFGHGSAGCSTCGLASPQGMIAAPQASPQGSYAESCDTCAPAKKKHDFLKKCFAHKPKMYTYEWVLKKKKVHGGKGCDTCGSGSGTESYVTPSGQYASPQGAYAAPQASYAAPQAYSAAQAYGVAPAYGAAQAGMVNPTSEMKAPEPAGDAVPPAPAAPAAPAPPAPTGAQSSLLFLSPTGN